jgi:hypothetical protein
MPLRTAPNLSYFRSARFRFTNRGSLWCRTGQMKTKFQPTANCQNSNCLTQGVHPKSCQDPRQNISCKLLILKKKFLAKLGV